MRTTGKEFGIVYKIGEGGNATAVYNRGVMAEKRDEKNLAAQRYAEARVLKKEDSHLLF